jgi:CarboxypepD_reg-like domain
MQKLIYYVTMLLFVVPAFLFAQPLQTIKGTVIDKDTKQPLIGASVSIIDLPSPLGAATDENGNYTITKVSVGRHKIQCSYVGYESSVSDVMINSAKEFVQNIELLEKTTTTTEAVITAYKKTNQPINEASVVSSRSFSVEETQRYASTANDPGRMAQGFPGVQPNRDNRSDIVIRGNSTMGLLWRLEGIDIPNPNHFARRGSAGGGITIFSASVLGNSDFSTGAFPAEYGNAFSGVFDMKFRKGNTEKREHTFKAGMLGLDYSTEGPIAKGRSSYLVNYRYSTLGILNKVGIHLVGARVDNTFQDLSFNLTFPSKNKKSIVSFWGIGGLSSEQERYEDEDKIKSFTDRQNTDFRTNMGATGLTYSYLINSKSYIKTTLAIMNQKIINNNDTLNVLTKKSYDTNDETYQDGRVTLASFYSLKISPRIALKTGFSFNQLFYDFRQKQLVDNNIQTLVDGRGVSFLAQPYAQLRLRPTEKWTINVGVHSMMYSLKSNNSAPNNTGTTFEPRINTRFQIADNQSVSLAFGVHQKLLPLGTYFSLPNNGTFPNFDLKPIKANHFVGAYEYSFVNGTRIHLEAYYQTMSNVPVGKDANSTYCILNDIQGFASETVVSKGKANNKGIDISLEKAFDKGTFLVLSSSVFQSKYTPLNGKEYSTQYNSRFTAALMAGKEWKTRNNGVFQLGTKILVNGGLPITPLLKTTGDTRLPQLDNTRPFSERIKAYYRPDVKIAYRKDKAKTAYTVALDVQNVIAHRNIDGLSRTYDPDIKSWVYRKQSSLVPILSFQIDF